jgi:hypothetical protein
MLALPLGAQALPATPPPSVAQLPLAFESNQGQTDARVGFLARGPGSNIFLTANEAVLTLPRAGAAAATQPVVRMKLVGAAANPQMEGVGALAGTVNYMRGRDAANWHTKVPTYRQVRYSGVYPGIDLVYYGQQLQLEYDFVVAPGADPDAIRLAFAGVGQTTVDARGDLVLDAQGGASLRFQKPVIYQVDGARRRIVEGSYVRHGAHEIGFRVGAYDRSRPLVIDPVLSYSTYLGGTGTDYANGIAVDATGAVYVSGFTSSGDFPTANALQRTRNGSGTDLFIAKLTPDGTSLVYATYLGGSGDESGGYIAVDSAGAAYVIGSSSSSDFPTVNALQAANSGDHAAVIAKLSADGSQLVYSTYLGPSSFGRAIAVDTAGAAYIAGMTGSIEFPLVNPVQPTLHGATDAFVAKLAPDGSALLYSTYLGGSLSQGATDIAVDSLGAAYVVGTMEAAPGFPTVNPLPGPGGGFDAFIAKFAPDGTLVYSSPLGGTTDEGATGIAVDASGAAYVTGYTHSNDFPTVNALQSQLLGTADAFVVKIAPEGGAMLYATFLGGLEDDFGDDIAVDAAGSAHIAGTTYSPDFPTVNPIQAALAGGWNDGFVAQLSPDGASLADSTYLGGSGQDSMNAIVVDLTGAAYVAGATQSRDFPTTASLRRTCSGGFNDAFIAKLAPRALAIQPAAASMAAVPIAESVSTRGKPRGGGGALDALLLAVLAQLAVAGTLRRRTRRLPGGVGMRSDD